MIKVTKEDIERVKEEKGKTKLLIYDTIFKAVFIKEQNVLLRMIKDIFDVEENGDPITILGYETVGEVKEGKTYRGDVLVRLSDKTHVLIEMNYGKDNDVIDRNMVNLVRIHNQVLKSGTKNHELKKYRMRGINFNNFSNVTGEPVEKYAFCNIDTGKVVSLIYSFCNIALEKCKDLVYDIDIKNLSKAVRWGAILLEEDMSKISHILGDDMLSMEEKESLFKTIEEVNNDERLLKEWILEDNEKMKLHGQMAYAREEGKLEGAEAKEIEVIKNMLEKNTDYEFISEITGKTIDEIKEIEISMKEI